MYTLMIDGVAIAVTDADREDAEALFSSDGFKDDLRSMTADGKPIWNGTAAFVVRAANEDETALFEDSDLDEDAFGDDDEDVFEGEADAEDLDDADLDEDDDEDAYEVMFLVPVDQFPEEG